MESPTNCSLNGGCLNGLTPQEVETPCGTPSAPQAASTVARPPPKPRRFPTVKFQDEEFDGMIKAINMENSIVSFTKQHDDTPLPSPQNLDYLDHSSSSKDSKETSTETVVPNEFAEKNEFAIDPKYLAPTPGPKLSASNMKTCMSELFDYTVLEDIEPPSGIFLLEMTRKDETKLNEFESLASQQQEDFEGSGFRPELDLVGMAAEQAELLANEDYGFDTISNDIIEELNEAEKSNEARNMFEIHQEEPEPELELEPEREL